MKFKDIEKSLKKESDAVKVPDVFASVKATPINRLLTGETPVQAFKKQIVIRLMVFALMILIVAFVGFAALALTQPTSTMGPDSYISFTLNNGTRYGFVVSADGYIKLAVLEKELGIDKYTKCNELTGNDSNTALNKVYTPNSTDEITIYALCSKNDLASYWCSQYTNYVLSMCINGTSITRIVSWPNRESGMIEYINSKVNENDKVTATSSADKIVAAYLSLF